MGTIEQRLANHNLIGLDTALFIYQFEANPRYLPLTTPIFTSIQSGQRAGITSVITLMELTVYPWQQGRADVARQYEALLVNFPNLALIETTRDIVRQAAQLRAQYRLRPVDALQVATALFCNATAFITNDLQLRRLQSQLELIILDDFV